jgi:HD-like signal output (HDOD) protein
LLLKNKHHKAVIPYIKHSITTALFCQAIAEETGFDPNTAYLIGLLHILPVVTNFDIHIEGRLTSPLLYKATSILLKNMGFPDLMCTSITNLFEVETNNDMTRLLKAAFSMAIVQSGKEAPFHRILNLESDFERLGITPQKIANQCARVELEQESIFKLLG